MKDTLQHQTGNAMKLLKHHVLRHLIDDIERFGCPQNFNGGPCEANFKPHKHMAQLTQRRQNTFIEQIGHRLSESYCLNRAMKECTDSSNYMYTSSTALELDREIGGSRFIIKKQSDGGEADSRYFVQWLGVDKKGQYPQNVLKFIYENLHHETDYPKVMCFTQHKREGVIFHGDCQYRSGPEWYDWVVINWEGNNPTIGQIYCFVDMKSSCTNSHPVIVNGNNIQKGECYAVISSLSSGTLQNIPGSSLFVRE